MSGAPRPYGSAAKAYLTAGYWPLPLPPRKKASPPGGYTGRDGRHVDPADVDRWITEHRSGNIGVRLPRGVAGVDVDAYKDGEHLASWEELTARCGPLPDAPWCSSRDDGISGVRLFRVPEAWEAAGKLPEGSNGISPGEVIQWHHRYVVCPPSIHPDTGRTYRWRTGSITGVADLPELPAPWLEALSASIAAPPRSRPSPSPRGSSGQPGEVRPGDDFNERADWLTDILGPHGWELHHEAGATLYVTRPGKSKREGHSATIGHSKDGVERLFVFSADAAPFEMETPYTKFAAYALLNHGGSYQAAARELGRIGYGEQLTSEAVPEVTPEERKPVEQQGVLPPIRPVEKLDPEERPGTVAGDAQVHGAPCRGFDEAGRLIVQAFGRNPVDIADEVATHILENNDPPGLFSMSPAAVILRDGALVPLDADGWLLYVARRVTFKVPVKGGAKTVAPPGAVMKLIPPVVIPELPPLDGIVTTPYLDRDGNVIAGDGYNPGTHLVLHSGGFKIPPVSASPSGEDVAQAVKLLSEEWLGDFPFASDADKANAIAVPLTMTGRMFFALAPLTVFDASTAGSGKGLLAATTSLITTGEPPQVMELPADGEEQRKKITSALLAGQELIMWDESHVISGRTLAAILTAERYSDRLLGGNKLISVTNRFTQVALGNNVEVWGDMRRRVVPARLVPDTEHPEDRKDFRHTDLEGWVRAHRGELLAAVLTIWRNWIAKGRPESDTAMGSFDRWAKAVGGALAAAGIDGFRSNTADWLSGSEDDDGWIDHLRQLRARFGDEWFTVAHVAEAVGAGYLKRPPVKRDAEKTLAELIGYGYRKIREKWHGDLRLVRSADRDSASGGRTWSVTDRHSQTPKLSSVWSGSSVDSDESAGQAASKRATDHADGRQHGQASSVHSKTAGQRSATDHADHADHQNLARECSGCGAAEDSILHAVNCLGEGVAS